ncbi:MAG: acetyl-CoA carboxylase biotin carboxylase subunit [Caldilineaceae bacterium]
MFSKILIANRGEIAVRIIRACQEMEIATVAVYSDADAGALHTMLADEAVHLGPSAPSASYLCGDLILAAAQRCGCDALHSGYGFLAENANFAAAVTAAGLTWIGPTAEVIHIMGSKTAARAAMQAAGVPVIPGYQASNADDDLLAAAEALGFPVLVKAKAGGGGKGMRIVHRQDDLPSAIAAARREAKNAFGDDELYLEKLITAAHHIEVQVLGDHHGQVVHLFERECSVQRHHQKIIEETPSPHLNDDLRHRMGEAAVNAARAVGYTNAGTLEFLVDEAGYFYFLEMNTRLQVEHAITELVTGVDLVQAQLRIAAGEPLPFRQEELSQRGHALECRLYAEDPAAGFLPSTGLLHAWHEPVAPGIRVDTGVTTGDAVTVYYDPMLAKLSVLAEDRASAIAKMVWALRNFVILGDLTTNLPFLRDVLNHPRFRAGQTTTDFVETAFAPWQPPQTALPDQVLIVAALADFLGNGGAVQQDTASETLPHGADPYSPWRAGNGFRIGG